MKVAYVCIDPGIPVYGTKGASVHVQEIIRAWRALGADVHLYCTRLGENMPDDLADVPVTVVPVGKGSGSTPREKAAAREKEVLAASKQITEAILADGADVVYERFSLFSTVLACVSAKLDIPAHLEVNAPLIDEQRDHRILVDEDAAWAYFRAQLHQATAVASVSHDVAQWCRDASPKDAHKSVVAPNGVNVERIAKVEAGSAPVVLFVGTLKPWHGTSDLLAAAALAKGRWQLRIVGDGPERGALEAQAHDLGLDVDFRGAVAPSEIPAHMTGAVVAVAPYPVQEDQYFSPLKIYEYSAAGLPVVASAVGQIPEIIRDRETGLLVPPSQPQELAHAIDALLADRELAARLGAAGRELMVREHTWERVLERIVGEVAHG